MTRQIDGTATLEEVLESKPAAAAEASPPVPVPQAAWETLERLQLAAVEEKARA